MNYKLWFTLVIINSIMLILSFIKSDLYYAVASLVLALYLQRSYSKVNFPELKILGHIIKDKTDNN